MTSFLTALGLVFVAELGDKTQLVALSLASRYSLAPVLAGVGAAYVITQALSASIGGLLGTALPLRAIAIGAGLLFIGFAVWTLLDRDDDEETKVSSRHLVVSVATAMTVAELGDKTMLTSAMLAARGDPVLTFLGGTIGICLSGAVAVVVGRTLGAKLPAHVTRLIAAALFAAFGVFLLLDSL